MQQVYYVCAICGTEYTSVEVAFTGDKGKPTGYTYQAVPDTLVSSRDEKQHWYLRCAEKCQKKEIT